MTTAHRPTWKAAYGLGDSVGKGYIPTRSYSARDLPGYLTLKQRQWGQGSIEELKQKDFKIQLEMKQLQRYKSKFGGKYGMEMDGEREKRGRNQQIDYIQEIQPKPHKRICKPGESQEINQQQEQVNPFPQDEDSQSFIREDNVEKKKKRIREEEDDQDQDDDEDDDSEDLLREYEKIKQQRQKQQLFKREQKHKQSVLNKQSQLLKGNPLIDSSYSIKKQWYEDTVFRNQAKKIEQKKSFVNDYVRSDFHRKFMNRYVMR